ncbi:MAG: DUF4185 domain-containing protein [Deltaproteobacteria bacterium]|nr:DUF4185 domain-containing protein [Deltaproteobacteria bacterium]
MNLVLGSTVAAMSFTSILISAVVATSTASLAHAQNWSVSKASKNAGVLNSDNSTTWCQTTAISYDKSGYAWVGGALMKAASNGLQTQYFVDSAVDQRVRLQCCEKSDCSGTHRVTVRSPYSSDASFDTSTVSCADKKQNKNGYKYGKYPGCQIQSKSTLPFVYNGSICGNGLKSPFLKDEEIVGQLTGYEALLEKQDEPGKLYPLLNETDNDNGQVDGADIAATFFAGGAQFFVFGDTEGPIRGKQWRSNSLAVSGDFNPADGITFYGWAWNPNSPGMAKEVFPSVHYDGICQTKAPYSEISKLPGAGFGYGANPKYYVVWFTSANCVDYPGIVYPKNVYGPAYGGANYSAFAYSNNGSDWMINTPAWTPTNGDFFPGAIVLDRYNMFIYLFGVSWYGSGVRLARVSFDRWVGPGTLFEYYYDTSPYWRTDNGDGEVAKKATKIIDNPGVRAEISVVWNSYAGVWMLMGLGLGADTDGFALWTSKEITGKWKFIDNQEHIFWGAAWYAPMMSESYLVNAGQDIYYNVSTDYDSYYNPFLWKAKTVRNVLSNCDSSDN